MMEQAKLEHDGSESSFHFTSKDMAILILIEVLFDVLGEDLNIFA